MPGLPLPCDDDSVDQSSEVFGRQGSKSFRQLLRGLQSGCDDFLSSNGDLAKNSGISDSATNRLRAQEVWACCPGTTACSASLANQTLYIASPATQRCAHGGTTEMRGWSEDGEQQTWTRLGASNDHSRLDWMSLLTNLTVLGIAGKRMIPGEVLRQQHKEHDANRRTS